MAERIRKETKMLVRASGNLNHPKLLKKVIGKKIDFVALGRAFLSNPRWIFNNFKIKSIPRQISRGFKK